MNNALTAMNEAQIREANGGKTYVCPFCDNYSGSYWKVYAHALYTGCFKKNAYLRNMWNAGWTLINIGKTLAGFIK